VVWERKGACGIREKVGGERMDHGNGVGKDGDVRKGVLGVIVGPLVTWAIYTQGQLLL